MSGSKGGPIDAPNKQLSIQPELKRAILRIEPEYFLWTDDIQERYGANLTDEHDFRIRQLLVGELFGLEVTDSAELDRVAKGWDDKAILAMNAAMLPLQGVGEDQLYLNEYVAHLGELTTVLSFASLYDYDLAEHNFQEAQRKPQSPEHPVRPHVGSIYSVRIRLLVGGSFHYGSLRMAWGYVLDRIGELGNEKIDILIPNKYVSGKDDGKRVSAGTILDIRSEAGGMQRQLEEIRGRLLRYLDDLQARLAAEFDACNVGVVYMADASEKHYPHMQFIFSDKIALSKVRFRHFMRDCCSIRGELADLDAVVGREREAAYLFLDHAFEDIISNFNPNLLEFRRKSRIIIYEPTS